MTTRVLLNTGTKLVDATGKLTSEGFRYLEPLGQVVEMVLGPAVQLPAYTVTTLPAATAAGFIYVSNEAGGATLAFADGTNWRRVQDRAIVS